MRRLVFFVLIVILVMTYGTAQAQVETEQYTMTYDGHERSYYVYTPATEATRLMMILHPVASSGLAMEVETDFNTIADAEGYIVVYPNSLDSVWDDGRLGTTLPPNGDRVDDVGFLAALAETVASEHGIDPDEIYIAGIGNGATMAMTAACTTPEVYAGVAVVSALMWDYQVENCGGSISENALDMIFVFGSRDPIYWIDGHPITDADGEIVHAILGAGETADFWLNFNGCDPAVYEDSSETTLTIFPACTDDTRFAWFSVLGGSATWLRSDARVNAHLGIDTGAILHAFFTGDASLSQLATQENTEEVVEARSWLLYVPTTYDDSKPTPLVVNLHGRFANAFSQANSSDFNTIAEREGIIVLYPNALNSDGDASQTEWNYGFEVPNYASPPHHDEAFIRDLIDDVDEKLNIDRDRMYVAGLSNGGAMAQRMACTEHDTYAAFVSVVASGFYGLPAICEDSGNAPMLFYNGTADKIMPWQGVPGRDVNNNPIYVIAPMDATAAFWASHNHCGETFDDRDLPSTDPDSSVRLLVFNDCPSDSAVVIFAVINGGHVWPGITDFENDLLGEVNMDYNASEIVWDFFSQYTRAGRVDADGNLIADTPITIHDVAPVALDDIPDEVSDTPDATAATVNPEESPEAFVIERLQAGGYVIFINHTATDPSQTDATNGDLESCETQQNLSDTGRLEAQVIGAAFTVLEIPVGEVYSSGFCRANDTATIAFGRTTERDDFFELGTVLLLLSEAPAAGTNTVIVGHPEILSQFASIESNAGDAFIFLPLGNGNFRPLTSLRPAAWASLAEFYVQHLQAE